MDVDSSRDAPTVVGSNRFAMGTQRKIGVFGAGHVGLVSALVFAELGNDVVCVDVDTNKVKRLQAGDSPVYEPGLHEMLCRNLENGHIAFTSDAGTAVRASEVVFVAVGTPSADDGRHDLRQVRAVALDIAKSLNGYRLVAIKSTVPPGTCALIADIIGDNAEAGAQFDVCSNPEFLREGCALQDAFDPDRIIIGADNPAAAQKLAELYAPLACTVIQTNLVTAEMIKYASNAFLATKISFINAIADICELVGADVSVVAQGMGADPRIGHDYLKPGLGYGGSCLPKDVESFITFAAAHGYEFKLLRAVRNVNDARIPRFIRWLEQATDGLQGKTVGVLGLAFKPNTDDLRDSKAAELIQALLERGATVKAYDPVVMPECRKRLPQAQYAENPYELARGCHALVIATDWDQVKTLDLAVMRDLMIEPILLDGRNVYPPDEARTAGFSYYGVGRASHGHGIVRDGSLGTAPQAAW